MRALALLLLSTLLASCSTSYQKNGWNGGYDEVRLAPDLYRISVLGSGFTSEERAEQIMMLRAAELTLQNGFQKFAVEEREMKSVQRTGYTGTPGGVVTVFLPTGHIVVRLLKAADARSKGAHDAATMQTRLRPSLT